MYHKLTKVCLKSFSARYFEVNMGRGCLLKNSIRPVHTPFPLFLTIYAWSRQSRYMVLALLCRVICIVSGDRKPPRVSLCSWCEQQKPWQWPANKAIVQVFSAYVFLNTNDDRAKTEVHKSMPRRCSFIQEHGRRRLLEGDIFFGNLRYMHHKVYLSPTINSS